MLCKLARLQVDTTRDGVALFDIVPEVTDLLRESVLPLRAIWHNTDVARFDGPEPDGSVPPPIRPRPPDPGDRHRGSTGPTSVPDWAAGRPDPDPDGRAAASAPSGNRQPPGQSWRAGKGDRSALLFVQESDPPTECIPKGAPRIGKLPLCGLAGV